MRVCTVVGCDGKHEAKGLCNKHYMAEYNAKNRDTLYAKQKEWRVEHVEKIKEYKAKNRDSAISYMKSYNKKYVAANKEKLRLQMAAYRSANKEKIRAAKAERYKANAEQLKAKGALWQKNNPEKCNAIAMRRKAKKLHASPLWANQKTIAEIYRSAHERRKETGIDWHVDHIVPLQSELVCGLHCESNLEVIPATNNRHKHNSWWPDMPEQENRRCV